MGHRVGLDFPDAMPRAIDTVPTLEIEAAPSLSLMALPGKGGIATRKIAILIAEGMTGAPISQAVELLTQAGAVTRLLSSRLGAVTSAEGTRFDADGTLENTPSVLFDALVLPDGMDAVETLSKDGRTLEFLKDQYRHCKSILVLGASSKLLQKAGIFAVLPTGEPDPGLFVSPSAAADDAIEKFIGAICKHRHPQRDCDPPLI